LKLTLYLPSLFVSVTASVLLLVSTV